MNEIPFVRALGDALEAAIAQPAAQRRPRTRRRLVLVTALALALAAASLAVAKLLSSPEKLATTGVGCYDRASLNANVSVPNGVASPLAACAAVYRAEGRPVPSLVACDNGAAVAVFPGRGPGTCRRLGLAPLPAGYAPALAKVARLERDALALERSRNCLAPAVLARRVDELLARTGWAGWHTQLRLDVSQGPCGTVTPPGGDGRESITGALDADHHVVFVFGTRQRATRPPAR